MTGRGTKAALAGCLAAAALFAPAGNAGAHVRVLTDNDQLLSYMGPMSLKAKRRIPYPVVCSAACKMTSTTTLVVKGHEIGPIVASSTLEPGKVAEPYMVITSKAWLRELRENVHKAVLRTQVTASSIDGTDTDTDVRVFHFHH